MEAMRRAQPYLEAKYCAYHDWGQDKDMPDGDNDPLMPAQIQLIRTWIAEGALNN